MAVLLDFYRDALCENWKKESNITVNNEKGMPYAELLSFHDLSTVRRACATTQRAHRVWSSRVDYTYTFLPLSSYTGRALARARSCRIRSITSVESCSLMLLI